MMESLEQQGPGRDEQGRERDLADHQNLPRAALLPGATASPALFQRRRDVRSGLPD